MILPAATTEQQPPPPGGEPERRRRSRSSAASLTGKQAATPGRAGRGTSVFDARRLVPGWAAPDVRWIRGDRAAAVISEPRPSACGPANHGAARRRGALLLGGGAVSQRSFCQQPKYRNNLNPEMCVSVTCAGFDPAGIKPATDRLCVWPDH